MDKAYEFIYAFNAKAIMSLWKPMDVIPRDVVRNAPGFNDCNVELIMAANPNPSSQDGIYAEFTQVIGAHVTPIIRKLEAQYGSDTVSIMVNSVVNQVIQMDPSEYRVSENSPIFRLAVRATYICYALVNLLYKLKFFKKMIEETTPATNDSSTVGPSIFPNVEVQLVERVKTWASLFSVEHEAQKKKYFDFLEMCKNTVKSAPPPGPIMRQRLPRQEITVEVINARKARKLDLQRARNKKRRQEALLEKSFTPNTFVIMSLFPNLFQ